MRDQYDFSKGVKNPYAAILKKQAAVNIDADTAEYFKRQAAETGIPYQKLINFYLAECVKTTCSSPGQRGRAELNPTSGFCMMRRRAPLFYSPSQRLISGLSVRLRI